MAWPKGDWEALRTADLALLTTAETPLDMRLKMLLAWILPVISAREDGIANIAEVAPLLLKEAKESAKRLNQPRLFFSQFKKLPLTKKRHYSKQTAPMELYGGVDGKMRLRDSNPKAHRIVWQAPRHLSGVNVTNVYSITSIWRFAFFINILGNIQ